VPDFKPPFKYSPAKRRWVDSTGKVTPKSVAKRKELLAKRDPEEAEGFGGVVQWNRTPKSDLYAEVEHLVGLAERGVDISNEPAIQKAGKRYQEVLAFVDPDEMKNAEAVEQFRLDPPQPIPTGIRSAMNLAEYYCNTEGDVFQHIEAPIDITFSELEISVPDDKGLERELQDYYGPLRLNMREVLYQIWLTTAIYGSAYPL